MVLRNLKTLMQVKTLRTFLPLTFSNGNCPALSETVSTTWLPENKHLRVLSCQKITKLLTTWCNLLCLRYLDLSYSKIIELPKWICSLYNLQTLLLSNCYDLSELPENIGGLINLRHLDVSNTNLRMMPPRFGRLKNLQVVTDFVVSKDLHSSKISELGQLSHLRTLSITKLENVAYFKHALEANLKSKKYLNELFFKRTTHHQVKNKNVHAHLQTHKKQYENVLINLQPHENLKKLMIENYDGTTFPNWLGDAIFS